MDNLPPLRRLLKVFLPEGIPWPGSVLYNWISATDMFHRHYERFAQDIARCLEEGFLLDIGTGPGRLLLKIHEQLPRLRLAGLDVSSAMVAEARENMEAAGLGKQIKIFEGNAKQLPFEDASFDVVVSTGSIHHWKNPTAGLNEVYRVLAGGGHALLYDLVSNPPARVFEESRREFGRLKTTLFWLLGFVEPYYTVEAFEALARPTRFKEGNTRFVGVLCCLALRKNSAEGQKSLSE